MIAIYLLAVYLSWAVLSFFIGWCFPELKLIIKQAFCRHVDSYGMDWETRKKMFEQNKHLVYPGSKCVRCGKQLKSNNYFRDKKGL
jgi:hypothetical protein